MNILRFSPVYRRHLWRNILIQFALYMVASMGLDSGMMLSTFLWASPVFWIGVILIMSRRPANPTRGDIMYLKYGLVVLSLLCAIILPAAWSLRGLV